jgi:hypothetical protein
MQQKQASFISQQENMRSLADILVASFTSLSESSDPRTLELHFETFLQVNQGRFDSFLYIFEIGTIVLCILVNYCKQIDLIG